MDFYPNRHDTQVNPNYVPPATAYLASIEKIVARDILHLIEDVCFSEEYREFRHRYGTKGQHDLIVQTIKEKYGL